MSFPRYRKYKDSGVEWLGEVPATWEVKRLRFVADLNPSKSEIAKLDRETAVSFLPMDAIGDDGTLRLDSERAIGEVENGYTYFCDGDVTMAKITPCYENGKGALMRNLTNGIGFGTTELIVARPKPSEIDGAYLHYLFVSPDFRNLGQSHMYGAGGQKRVPDAFVRNFIAAFPSISEQEQISTFLDRETEKIDVLIAEQERLIELLKEKREAVISHAVTKGLNPGAPMKPSGVAWLGEIPKYWGVGQSRRLFALRNERAFETDRQLTASQKHGVIYQEDYMELEGHRVVQVIKGADILKHVEPNDFVISMRSFQGGIEWCKVAGCISSAYVMLVPSEGIHFPFFAFLLKSQSYIQALQSTTNLVRDGQALRYGNFTQVDLPLVPMREQVAIADFLSRETAQMDALIAEANQSIDLLQERRTALISAAVTGQIDVRQLVEEAIA